MEFLKIYEDEEAEDQIDDKRTLAKGVQYYTKRLLNAKKRRDIQKTINNKKRKREESSSLNLSTWTSSEQVWKILIEHYKHSSLVESHKEEIKRGIEILMSKGFKCMEDLWSYKTDIMQPLMTSISSSCFKTIDAWITAVTLASFTPLKRQKDKKRRRMKKDMQKKIKSRLSELHEQNLIHNLNKCDLRKQLAEYFNMSQADITPGSLRGWMKELGYETKMVENKGKQMHKSALVPNDNSILLLNKDRTASS